MRRQVGIKQKMLLLLIAWLAVTITSLALLAAYTIDRQNESAAFTELDRDLGTWRRDLEQSVARLRSVALTEIGDPAEMDLLSQLLVLQIKVDANDPRETATAPELRRTLGYEKSIALGRLLPVLRAGGFAEIAVYLRGRISHVLAPTSAGMMIRSVTQGGEVWLHTSRDANGDLSLQSWPDWQPDAPPRAWPLALEGPPMPTVSFVTRASPAVVIELAIPVLGRVEIFHLSTGSDDRFISGLIIPDGRRAGPVDSARPRSTLALVVFRKLIDRAALAEVFERTGHWATILSPDRSQLQQLGLAGSVLSGANAGPALAGIAHRTIQSSNGSYYQALMPWYFRGQPQFILSLTASREPTLQNIRQTLSAILLAAGCLLALSAGVGAFWLKRFIDPIVALTAAVKNIGNKTYVAAESSTSHITSYEELEPIAVRASDEVGDLAAAFNAMIAQLRRSIETLEQRVQARTAEAMRLARVRSDFLAQMSHELRTPLNAILGYAQILRRDAHVSERQRQQLTTIQESGEHLLALINDILDLARTDAGKLRLDLEEVRLDTFLQAVTEIIRVKAQEKDLQFHVEARDLPAGVRVDSRRLRQILLNLLGNAVKFTDTGCVSLRVQAIASASPVERAAQTDSVRTRLRFEVEDTGIGMADEQRARLFQPFEQLGEAKRREGGTGLGLAISSALVRLMGGEIAVRSELGKGSCFGFEIELPVATLPPIPAQRKAPIAYQGASRKILVADDVAQSRRMLVEALTEVGFSVSEAADGGEAVAQARRLVPDLILMDLMMPVMDGLEAMRQIQATPGLEAVPVFVLSASAGPEEQARSRAAGAARFFPKPLDHEGLLQAIGEQLHLQWTDA